MMAMCYAEDLKQAQYAHTLACAAVVDATFIHGYDLMAMDEAGPDDAALLEAQMVELNSAREAAVAVQSRCEQALATAERSLAAERASGC